MSIVVIDESAEGTDENPTVVAQEQGVMEGILSHLQAVVYLLEVVADMEHGETIKMFEGEE